jgi:hypothetical protein
MVRAKQILRFVIPEVVVGDPAVDVTLTAADREQHMMDSGMTAKKNTGTLEY